MRYMPGHIVVDFCKILGYALSSLILGEGKDARTETKKLVVPSARENIPGNSFSQVSSPYMTSLPPCFASIWASHVS